MSTTNFTSLHSFITRDSDINPDPYGYRPTLSVCILFLCLFGASTFIHLCQSIAYRKWFFLYTAVLAGLLEILGWSGRLWSNRNLPSNSAYLIQIICTIQGPTPLLAANFVILAGLIKKLGDRYCRLRPKIYSIIFLTCDIIALGVQGTGGGIAASSNDPDTVNLGSHIMLGGIVFQLVVIICYMLLAMEFFWRYSHNLPIRLGSSPSDVKPSLLRGPAQWLVYALMFNTACLFIRAIYRTVELTDGFHGKIIETQWLFNVFDGAMIVLAMVTFNIAHPGLLLKDDDRNEDDFIIQPILMENSGPQVYGKVIV
ncbi:hypothetical protein GYMLUDRAFT_231507 [Collybiopsis luxurians FD-317 M1]|uniref:RTA1-domain-containing protein n=1 Tax=Collybiopsis luxurians FD-317 M1 TaxID=944289 RepID=A0A0D0CAA1_9AGAR|nr:hypothetical protein GYMLUDRAFT_231507 [Collybiopsis luxurians FD-317 M1]